MGALPSSSPVDPPCEGRQRYRAVVDVHLVLRRDQKVLLGQRKNTGYEDGKLHLPAGHLEEGESLVDALAREAKEELGILISPEDVVFAHIMHNRSSQGRIASFFEITNWDGEPQNMEPEKCAGVSWFDLMHLPENIVGYAKYALDQYAMGNPFSEYGWR